MPTFPASCVAPETAHIGVQNEQHQEPTDMEEYEDYTNSELDMLNNTDLNSPKRTTENEKALNNQENSTQLNEEMDIQECEKERQSEIDIVDNTGSNSPEQTTQADREEEAMKNRAKRFGIKNINACKKIAHAGGKKDINEHSKKRDENKVDRSRFPSQNAHGKATNMPRRSNLSRARGNKFRRRDQTIQKTSRVSNRIGRQRSQNRQYRGNPLRFNKILVSNIDRSVTKMDLSDIFEHVGSISEIADIHNAERSKTDTVEITFRSEQTAFDAVRRLDGIPLNSRQMVVTLVHPDSRN